jgi:hypothetical protein
VINAKKLRLDLLAVIPDGAKAAAFFALRDEDRRQAMAPSQ